MAVFLHGRRAQLRRHWLFALVCTVPAAAEVISFDPMRVFERSEFGDGESDLLVLVERGRSLGRSAFDKTLRRLEEIEGQRARHLVVSACRGCAVYDELLERWQFKEADLPVALLFPDHDEHSAKGKFKLHLASARDPLTAMQKFVQDLDNGFLRPWLRGLEVDSEAPSGLVREVVGSTFMEQVVDPDADVVILLYGPFCGFSKLLQPVFKELARELEWDSRLRFARYDITQNEPPPANWAGELESHRVPRIYLYRQGHKTDPIVFPPEGDKTAQALLDWLQPLLPRLKDMSQNAEPLPGVDSNDL
eukprot:TRINITY_DN76278_c0_g1_i1.p1 TRINITY_DN76278_c0_g1~~TRINITY_DN76278_c0_g1_i1.p1  ORF type:complete len:306 (+),score=49.69 TRINITY_DN76278_c0_g1_i1:27-944(+)